MLRSCFALLLLLSLWPSPAAARVSAHVQPLGEQDRITAVSGGAQGIARSSGNPELLQALEQRISAGTKRLAADRLLPPEGELFLAQLRRLVPVAPPIPVGVFSPLCERLPYHATAPPPAR